jgi:hypothetical protein
MPRPDGSVIWIASYPKSGNTWARFLVCNLVFGPQESAAALNHLAPDIHELASSLELPMEPLFIKTHYPYSTQLPLAAHSVAAIYVVRDPADVMLSNFHYAKRSGALPADVALSEYVDRYLTERGDGRWVQRGIGRWDDHVRSWLAVQHPYPLLLLRYEDLLGDALRCAQNVCAFLGLNRSPALIEQAVAGASFSRMREIEEADIRARQVGIFYKPYLQPPIDAGLRFMRSGRAGEAADVLTPAQQRAVTAHFGEVMLQLGYCAAREERTQVSQS